MIRVALHQLVAASLGDHPMGSGGGGEWLRELHARLGVGAVSLTVTLASGTLSAVATAAVPTSATAMIARVAPRRRTMSLSGESDQGYRRVFSTVSPPPRMPGRRSAYPAPHAPDRVRAWRSAHDGRHEIRDAAARPGAAADPLHDHLGRRPSRRAARHVRGPAAAPSSQTSRPRSSRPKRATRSGSSTASSTPRSG